MFGRLGFVKFFSKPWNYHFPGIDRTFDMPMIVHINKGVPAPADGEKDVVFFRKADGPGATGEFQVRFSDYRSTGGVQLPYRWTTTAGDMREVFDVSSYEVNPANISESFSQPKIMVRTKKDGQ